MRTILLCGGSGTRFDGVFPKPMNLVNGTHLIWYVMNSIPFTDITVVYNKILDVYSFKEYLIKAFPSKNFEFFSIDYQTRGPAESLYVGLKDVENRDEQILVLDNDNVYTGLDDCPRGNFLICTKNLTGFSHYSFVETTDDGCVKNILERQPISNVVCIGGYGFESLGTCLDACKIVILRDGSESFLSKVVQEVITSGKTVHSVLLPNAYSLGTSDEIINNIHKIQKKRLRVVCDLDNTIVSYPEISGDYASVRKINHITEFLSKIRSDGHYVIIHTARGMVSSADNIGRVVKNNAKTVIDTLERFGVEYDELIFGKPYGDLYIDDKAFNTFQLDLFKDMGFYTYSHGMDFGFLTNRYNKIQRVAKDRIRKSGPAIQGEVFFYKNVPNCELFPKLYSHNQYEMILEYINGTGLDKLYYEGLLSEQVLADLIHVVKTLHTTNINDGVVVPEAAVNTHYMGKLEERSLQREFYPFPDFDAVRENIVSNMGFINDLYMNNVIHGDLWFSNIMIFCGKFKFFDPRGKFADKLTVKGHIEYDWAKLYQSILGLDSIIQYGKLPEKRMINEFWRILNLPMADVANIKVLTAYTIFCTFPFYNENFERSKLTMIWDLIRDILNEVSISK